MDPSLQLSECASILFERGVRLQSRVTKGSAEGISFDLNPEYVSKALRPRGRIICEGYQQCRYEHDTDMENAGSLVEDSRVRLRDNDSTV